MMQTLLEQSCPQPVHFFVLGKQPYLASIKWFQLPINATPFHAFIHSWIAKVCYKVFNCQLPLHTVLDFNGVASFANVCDDSCRSPKLINIEIWVVLFSSWGSQSRWPMILCNERDEQCLPQPCYLPITGMTPSKCQLVLIRCFQTLLLLDQMLIYKVLNMNVRTEWLLKYLGLCLNFKQGFFPCTR